MKTNLIVLALALSTAASLADSAQSVNDLIPRLADASVPSRYAAQMELQALTSSTSRPGHEAERAELSTLLATKVADASVPQPARVWLLRQLEYIGAGEAVQALTQVLADQDAELRECARRALQKNADPGAGASLRAALKTTQDARWTIGLIGALGDRQDAEAVPLIVEHLSQGETAGPAALALGRIASPAAIEALWSAVEQKNPAAGESLIIAANKLAASGEKNGANTIYQKLYQSARLTATRAAALAGLAKTDPSAAAAVVPAALASDDARLQNAAVRAAPVVLGANLSRTVVELLPKLSASTKAQVIGLLDASAEPSVIDATRDGDDLVRNAAIEALGRIGGSGSIPVLVRIAASDSRADQQAARGALVKISSNEAVLALRNAAAGGEAKFRAAAINALAARQDREAVPALLRYAEDPDATVQQSAFAALGQLAGESVMEPVAKLALKSKSAEASQALESMARRVQDKPTAAQRLLALAPDESARALLLEPLAALGGSESLAAVSKMAASADAELQSSAIRALGNWPDLSAAKPLLALADNAGSDARPRLLAVQALVRLIKSADSAPVQERADAALAAMKAAPDEDSKRLVLSALATVPHPNAIAAIKSCLTDAALKKDAGFAGLALAELLLASDKPSAKELAEAIKAADISTDVTRQANRLLRR